MFVCTVSTEGAPSLRVLCARVGGDAACTTLRVTPPRPGPHLVVPQREKPAGAGVSNSRPSQRTRRILLTGEKLAERIRASAADGVHHIVEVAFAANTHTDAALLAQGGSIATYATNAPTPEIPYWQLVFMNARIFFVGSDDVPADAKIEATRAINHALAAGWQGLDIAEIVPLDEIARAHELVEHPVKPGRVVSRSDLAQSDGQAAHRFGFSAKRACPKRSRRGNCNLGPRISTALV